MGHGSDPGRKRERNEDAYVALLPPDTPPGVDAVLAVADGLGGHQAGEVASALAVRAVSERLGAQSPGIAGEAGGPAYRVALRETVQLANQEIISQAQGDRSGMGTTLTLGLIEGSRLHLAHVGDSRAYLMRGDELSPISRDHSWVAEEVRAGRLSPQEAASHPWRNLVTRALGVSVSVEVDTEIVALEPGDLVLLCSDGLHGVVSDAEIASSLRGTGDLQALCDGLIQQANARGGPDNITVVLARVG